MRSRFPHGGEVLGAAPANPILAPVLSKDLSLSISRQRDLLDLQAIQRISGLVGYWKSDPQYLFEDSAGTTPASTSGTGPVGAWNAVNASYALGSEINTAPATWTVPAEITNNGDGSYTYNTSTTRAIYKTFSAMVGVLRVAFTVTNYVSGYVSPAFRGVSNWSPFTGNGTYVFNIFAGTNGDYNIYLSSAGVANLTVSNISIKQVTSNSAYQAITANKPILRKTPTTGVYWLDANTSTSALNVALGNLGSACTLARATAEGVTFTENVSITSTYNIAPAYGFNSDVAIFNRALTATEKALITRYMQRAVPMLGANLVTNGTFDDGATGWSVGTNWSIGGGIATKTGGVGGGVTQAYTLPVGSFYAIRGDFTVIAGAFNFHVGGSQVPPSITSSSSGLYIVARSAGTNIGVNGNTTSVGTLDNLSFRQIL